MPRKSMNRTLAALLSVGVAAGLAGTPLVFATKMPDLKSADTQVVNAGIYVNAGDPSDDVHLVSSNADPSNHELSPARAHGTADFVIFLSGISRNDGNNFTAPITAQWHTQGNGSTSSFASTTGSTTFANKYANHYQIIKVPVRFDSHLFSEKTGSFASFNFVITSATNASIRQSTATVLIVNGR
jgi:hypothetical protein